MIVIDAKIENTSLLLSVRAMRKVTKYCFYLLGKYWHEKILPKHFKAGAYSEYSYSPRGAKYEARKLKKYQHSIPNVFTGLMRDEVLSQANQDVRETSKGVRIHIHGPKYTYQYKPGGPDKAGELIAVSNRDREMLTRFMEKHLESEAKKLTKVGVANVQKGIAG